MEAPADFITAPAYPAGIKPWSVAAADFNGDGIVDLAVADVGDGNGAEGASRAGVSILLGNGDGTFQAPNSYVLGHAVYWVAVADFNGDGHPDVAVSGIDNSGNPFVTILLGNGDGTFAALPSFLGGGAAVGDFNGDGIPDLVGYDGSGFSVWLGNGDGTFQTPQSIIANAAGYLAVGDFNGDGILDLALANGDFPNNSAVSILLGNGDGSFQAPQRYAVGQGPRSVVVGDFNGDGNLDLALADYGNGNGLNAGVAILLGNGDGSFQPARLLAAGAIPESLAVGDFNGDGHLDLAVTDQNGVNILLGDGDGTFQAPVAYAANGGPAGVAVGDFNHDGIQDLVVANAGLPGSVSILLGKGDGTFKAARSYWSGGGPLGYTSITPGDFNGDGIPDLAVTNSADGTATVFLGNGDGSFQLGQSYSAGGDAVAVGDFNGDGIPDLAVVTGILLGNGDGTFQALHRFMAGNGPNSVAAGDFNGDGKLDVVTTNFALAGDPRHPEIIENGVRVLLGNGDGTFQAGQAYPVGFPGSRPAFVALGDFNGDGKLDLAVTNTASGGLSILLGKGDGTFQGGRTYAAGPSPQWLAVADFNGDGRLDIAIASAGISSNDPGSVNVLLGKGDGSFQPMQKYRVGAHPLCVTVADFNGDGVLDLAAADSSGVSILLGKGDGTFQAAQSYAAGSGGNLAVADFNGDGLPDLALSNSVTILLNQP